MEKADIYLEGISTIVDNMKGAVCCQQQLNNIDVIQSLLNCHKHYISRELRISEFFGEKENKT